MAVHEILEQTLAGGPGDVVKTTRDSGPLQVGSLHRFGIVDDLAFSCLIGADTVQIANIFYLTPWQHRINVDIHAGLKGHVKASQSKDFHKWKYYGKDFFATYERPTIMTMIVRDEPGIVMSRLSLVNVLEPGEAFIRVLTLPEASGPTPLREVYVSGEDNRRGQQEVRIRHISQPLQVGYSGSLLLRGAQVDYVITGSHDATVTAVDNFLPGYYVYGRQAPARRILVSNNKEEYRLQNRNCRAFWGPAIGICFLNQQGNLERGVFLAAIERDLQVGNLPHFPWRKDLDPTSGVRE